MGAIVQRARGVVQQDGAEAVEAGARDLLNEEISKALCEVPKPWLPYFCLGTFTRYDIEKKKNLLKSL